MLQQILQDMWVDPELLAELDEGQKQTLFCRMREEQVRRWMQWDKQALATEDMLSKRPKSTYANKIERHVGFLLGEDGEPWTWVMGDHQNDRSIDDIIEQEAREEARKQAEKEAQQMRKSVEAELSELLDLNQKQIEAMEAAVQRKDDNEESLDIYNTVEEVKERISVPFQKNVPRKTINNINNIRTTDNNVVMMEKRETLNEISLNKPKKVSQRVAQWEKKVMEERESEILRRLKSIKMKASLEAEEAEQKQDELWRESERKAKEAEHQIREIARRAREEHRRTSVLDMEVEGHTQSPSPTQDVSLSPTSMSPTQRDDLVANPVNKQAVCDWFRNCELERGAGLERDTNQIAPWFHGLITRQEAETLLQNKPKGTFLVRVSEKIWGYAISYQDGDRCKHYLIDAYGDHYQFFNHNQTAHNTLGDFIRYYGKNPITTAGYELLIKPCARVGVPDIFIGPSGLLLL